MHKRLPNHDQHRPDAKELLRAARQRVTPVRVAVIEALAASPTALDAAAVVKAARPADRVSVYRTLNTLVEAGIAHRIDAGDRIFRYSLTDHSRCDDHHGHKHDHPHIVCDSCGSVECLTDAIVSVRHPAGGEGAGVGRSRFRVRAQEVTLRGTCERCEVPPAATKPARAGTARRHGGARARE
jgi:Fur family ferric uptake transcriptional regulator